METFTFSPKIDKQGFYCPCDTTYFNAWAKYFLFSVKKFAPWAHIHFHIFDATASDEEFCKIHGCSFSKEVTPLEFSESLETKKDFWVNIRFIRLKDIYENDTKVMAVDADCLLIKPLSNNEFESDTEHSWVTTAKKREQVSLGSAVGFGADEARHILSEKLTKFRYTDKFKWCLDQIVMDEMLEQGSLRAFDTKYSDYKMTEHSVMWTGKGPRKNKTKYQEKIKEIMGE